MADGQWPMANGSGRYETKNTRPSPSAISHLSFAISHRLPGSDRAGQCSDIDIGGARSAKRFGAFVDGCSRGRDIIHEQDPLSGHFLRAEDHECATEVPQTSPPAQRGLRLSLADPNQVAIRERESEPTV